uniref:Uncharacterized protein n=1 Tax=Amphimedon queenslandica TaxID=400682 RepID=A0A1X7V8W0_AMPQE
MSLASNISLYFANNTATLAGDAIYSTNLYNCTLARFKDASQINNLYWKVFKMYLSTILHHLLHLLNFAMKQEGIIDNIQEHQFMYQSMFSMEMVASLLTF